TRVWLSSTTGSFGNLSPIKFGPPPPPTVVGQNYYASYAFYVMNMPPAGKVTLEFSDPVTNVPAFRCTFDLQSGSTTTEPTLVCSPTITTQPASLNICGASTARFSIVADGVTSYQWQVSSDNTNFTNISNGGDYSGATTAVLDIANPNTYTNKYYRVVLSSTGCPTTTSSSALLTANPKPTAQFSTSNICGTGSRNLKIDFTGTAPWSFTYTKNGGSSTTVSNITNSTYYLAVNAVAADVYAITSVSDRYCSNSSLTGTVSLTTNALPTISASTATACLNSSSFNLSYSSLTGSANKFSLSATGRLMPGFSNIVDANITSSPLNITIPSSGVPAGTYDFNLTIKNTTTGCVSDIVPITVTVATPPTMSISASTLSFCSGSNVTLTAAPAGLVSYTWVATSGSTPSNVVNPTVTPTTATTYTVTGVDANGCSATASITLTPTAGPTLNITAGSSTICRGNATTLTASGGSTYTWTPSTGLSATTGASVVAAPTTTTTYTVTSENSTGCQSVGTITVTVNTADFTVTPSATICSGTTQTLTASSGTGFVWYPYTDLYTDAAATTAYTGTVAATVYAKPSATTTYYVSGTNNGCSGVKSTTLTISFAPINFSTSVGDSYDVNPYTFCSNGTSSFDLPVNTTSAMTSMSWQYSTDGITYTDLSTATTISGITYTPSSTGSSNTNLAVSGVSNSGYAGPRYLRVVLSDGTCTYYHKIVIYDTKGSGTAPVPTVSKSTVCSGESAVISIGEANSSYTLQWQLSTTSATTGFTNISSATGSSYTTPGLTATSYYRVVYSGGGGCAYTTEAATVTVNSVTITNTLSASSTCTNGSNNIVITGSSVSSATYQWEISTTSSSSGFSAIVGAINKDYTLPNTVVTQTTWYRRLVTVGSCSATASSAVEIYSPIASNQITNSVTAFCGTATATTINASLPSGGSGSYTYKWQSSSNGTTFTDIASTNTQNYTTVTETVDKWYRRIVTTPGSCADTSASFKIEINDAPTITVTSNQSICSGSSVTLVASGGVSYSWSASGFTATGSTIIVSPSATTIYTVTGTSSNGCTNTAQVTVTVTTSPVAPTLSTSTKTVCSNASSFDLSTIVSSGTGVEWFSANTTDATYKLASTTVTTAGKYYAFSKVSSCYSATSVSLTLVVTDVTKPVPTLTTINLCSPATANLRSIEPTAPTGVTYKWFTGSTTSSTEVADPASVSTGTYYLFAYSADGNCYGVASDAVSVNVGSLVTPTLSSSTASACSPSTINLNSYYTSDGTSSYAWYTVNTNPSPATLVSNPSQISTTGTYYLYATTAAGCIGPASSGITVTINSKPSSAISSPESSCSGQSRTITATSNASSPVYVWQISNDAGSNWSDLSNAGVYSGVTTSTLTVSNTTGLGGKFYRYTVTSSANCSSTSNPAVLVEETAPTISTEPVNSSSSVSGSTSFTVAYSNSPTADFQWQVSTNGGSSYSDLAENSTYGGTTSPTLSVSSIIIGMNNYKYRCRVFNNCGADTSSIVTLTVSALNPGTIGSDQTICSGATPSAFTSSASASGGTGTISYQWQSSTTSTSAGF
ncbi:MAG: beta strand repeat-containing protein, partial [bacterium]